MSEADRDVTPDAGAPEPRPGGEGARLHAIIDQVADGIVIVDGDGEIRFVNSAATALFGRPAEELVGAPFGFPVVAGEATEIDVLRRAAAAVVAELRTVEIDWDGAPALLISLRDVTERNRAEEQARELVREQAARAEAEAGERRYRLLAEEKAALAEENARLYRRAQEGSRAKSEFLAVVSHELRTPLNAIIGYTDLLQTGIAGPLNEKQRAQLGRVEVNSRHLLEVVDDILTFSGLEAGWEDVRPQPVDYAELVRDVGARIQPLAERKGLSLRVEPPEAPCRGETDAQKVRQVLLNLLTNATKFTDEGAIVFDAAVEEEEIVFRVSDTGIGISAAHLAQIWEPFRQVEPSHTRTVGGTGLGLSLARRLTTLMGGEVGVESTEGEGSTFTVRLPLRVAARSSPPS